MARSIKMILGICLSSVVEFELVACWVLHETSTVSTSWLQGSALKAACNLEKYRILVWTVFISKVWTFSECYGYNISRTDVA